MEEMTDTYQEKMDAMLDKLDTHHERMMACLGKTEATDLEASPEEIEEQSIRRGQIIAAERPQKSKERTRGNCGSRKKLTAAGRTMTHHAEEARCKGNVVGKNLTRDNMVQGTLKRQTFGRRHQLKPEHKNGIRNRGLRQQL
jgi:hypothetical protein